VDGHRLLARGVSDMKFAAPLYAGVMDALEPKLRDRVLIAYTFDEEVGGSLGTKWLVDDYGLKPTVCFLPDGGDNFQIEADEKGVLQFRVKTQGRSAHGSRPWLGENALDKLLAIYRDLRAEFPVIDRPGEWGPTLNLGKIVGGAAANQVPDSGEGLFDVRFTETTSLEPVIARIGGIVGDRGEFSPVVQGEVFHLDRESPWCRWLQEASRRHRGGQGLGYYRSEGASDARFLARHSIPTVITKPLCGGHHSAEEWIDLASWDAYAALTLDFVRKAASV
jgi:succinyl-diaminopimelate desuccinylase